MLVIGGLVLGAVIGALTAKRRGGKTPDLLQYAFGYAIAFMLVGLVLTIVIERMAA